MDKKVFYMILILLAGFACEEVYKPDLEQVENKVVIEALVTNDTSKNFVKISKTQNFFEKRTEQMVSGATVELIDAGNRIYTAQETKTGYFTLDHATRPGEQYQLRVIAEGETYESDVEVMPLLPAYDSIYAEPETVTSYEYSSYGEPIPYTDERIHVFVDLPVSDSLKNYRFFNTKTLEWVIIPPALFGPPPAPIYGWSNFGASGNFNVAGPAEYGAGDIIKKHSLISLSRKLNGLLSSEIIEQGAFMVGWVINLNEYGMSAKTFDYYQAMVDQLEASGKLFDAVYAQLGTNIRCVSNPDKSVLGYFELSSYRFSRYFVSPLGGSAKGHSHPVHKMDEFPPSDTIQTHQTPDFWVDRFTD
jgi:hypothetical protein